MTLLFIFSCSSKLTRAPSNDGNLKSEYEKYSNSFVQLKWKGEPFCSATLITANKILTAAHCLRKFYKQNQQNIKKNLDLEIDKQTILKQNDFQIFYSKDFDFNEPRPSNTIGDVAIIQLKNDTNFQHSFLLLNHFEKQVGDDFFTAGFGPNPNILNNNDLKIGKLRMTRLIPNEDEFNIETHLIFKNGPIGSGMICGGDSGGPIILNRNNSLYILGVLSASRGSDDLSYNNIRNHDLSISYQEFKSSKECASDIGINLYTNLENYLDFVADPKKYGQSFFKKPIKSK